MFLIFFTTRLSIDKKKKLKTRKKSLQRATVDNVIWFLKSPIFKVELQAIYTIPLFDLTLEIKVGAKLISHGIASSTTEKAIFSSITFHYILQEINLNHCRLCVSFLIRN